MNIDEIDFYELCLQEGEHFYSDIQNLERNLFNQWIRENLREIKEVISFEEVAPQQNLLNTITGLGYEHRYYQCHYSAKALTILHDRCIYFTGFLQQNSNYYPIITHSFNILNEEIIDLARIENQEDLFTNDDRSSLPHLYYGIEIPREFILRYREETLNENSMNPLLYEWFLENN